MESDQGLTRGYIFRKVFRDEPFQALIMKLLYFLVSFLIGELVLLLMN